MIDNKKEMLKLLIILIYKIILNIFSKFALYIFKLINFKKIKKDLNFN